GAGGHAAWGTQRPAGGGWASVAPTRPTPVSLPAVVGPLQRGGLAATHAGCRRGYAPMGQSYRRSPRWPSVWYGSVRPECSGSHVALGGPQPPVASPPADRLCALAHPCYRR